MKPTIVHGRSLAAIVGVLIALIMAAPTTSADPLNPGVLSPSSPQFGKTYGEWSAAWWQYVFSIPASTNPLLDPTGAKCGIEQSGPVFFLVGTFTVTPFPGGGVIGIANRTQCTVPAGVALFFPILNSECSTAEGNGITEADLRACAVALMQGATNLAAEVDGRATAAASKVSDFVGASTDPSKVMGIAFDENGNLYAADFIDLPEGSTIYTVDVDTGLLTPIFKPGIAFIHNIAFNLNHDELPAPPEAYRGT